jgi:replicative DNA helicase
MHLTGSLQENLITILAYDDEAGGIVANLVEPTFFEGDYAEIARGCLEYWRLYRRAPKDHTADLFSKILEDPNNRRAPTIRRILVSMFEISSSINTKYVLDQISRFKRVQTLKDAILKSAEKIQVSDSSVEDIEALWLNVLKSQSVQMDEGLSLVDYDEVIASMGRLKKEFTFGITVLNELSIVPYRRSVNVLVGATGAGKSWFLTHVGKSNLLTGKKILHVSLEMSEQQVVERYYQALFSVTKRDLRVYIPVFVYRDSTGSSLPNFKKTLDTVDFDLVHPKFTLSSPFIREELESHVGNLRGRAKNLRVRAFPSQTLTVPMLEAYLDTLETVYNFLPDIILLDYVGIMKLSTSNYRVDLGQTLVGLRAIADRRNIALVTVQQANRHASASGQVRLTDVSEDWSLANTADQAFSLSATEEEAKLDLARIFVGKARSERDKFEILITQSYGLGQFALDSVMMRDRYTSMIGDLVKNEDERASNVSSSGDGF